MSTVNRNNNSSFHWVLYMKIWFTGKRGYPPPGKESGYYTWYKQSMEDLKFSQIWKEQGFINTESRGRLEMEAEVR